MMGFRRKPVVVVVALLTLVHIAATNAVVGASEVPRPRGVELSRAALYEATGKNTFQCLDGLKTIKYEQINDDFCDCADASDEPGTAACPTGHFHCVNAGHRPARLPSSRVNDGICDCCDASDEWAATGTAGARCVNDCSERGQEDRVREKQRAELARLGSQLKADMAAKGKLRKSEQDGRLADLRRSHAEAEALVTERDAIRRDAEALEKDALEVYRQQQQEESRVRAEQEAAQTAREAADAFRLFDSNADGRVELADLKTRAAFDRNRDGEVSDEEALYFLGDLPSVDLATFVEVAWPQVKPYLMIEAGMFRPPVERQSPDDTEQVPMDEPRYDNEDGVEEAQLHHDDHDDDEDERLQLQHEEHHQQQHNEDEEYEEEEEMEEEELETGEGAVEPVEPHVPHIEYDPETQSILDQANAARQQHLEAEREMRQIASEITSIEQQLEKDYGADEEYAALHGECFSYEDREYVYKVCPFDRAVQQSRGGGIETRLGAWDRWAGSHDNPYATMMFTNGAACWNGPQRSATVHLECGLETKLLAVSEPNRCEYVCTMQTPAACSVNDATAGGTSQQSSDAHDEL